MVRTDRNSGAFRDGAIYLRRQKAYRTTALIVCLSAIASIAASVPLLWKPSIVAKADAPGVTDLQPHFPTPQLLARDATSSVAPITDPGDTLTHYLAPPPSMDGTPTLPPPVPAWVTAQPATDFGALVSWQGVSDAPNDPTLGYVITGVGAGSATSGVVADAAYVDASATQAWLTGLATGSYSFSVAARTSDYVGSTATSAPVSVSPSVSSPVVPNPSAAPVDTVTNVSTCTGSTPSAPGSVKATSNDQSVSATWTAPACNGGSPITSYTATLYTATGTSTGKSVSGSALKATFTGLTNGNSYYVAVYASSVKGNGPAADSNDVTPLGPPTVKVTRVGARTSFARGEAFQFSVKITNPYSTLMSSTVTTDTVPSDVVPPALNWITADGVACPSTECQISGRTLTFTTSIAPSSSHTFTYWAIGIGSDHGCSFDANVATSTLQGYSGSNSSTAATEMCDGGDGSQPWWTLDGRSVGPESSAAVDVASGNLLVRADDSTPIKGHGALVLSLHRSYNAASQGMGILGSPLANGWTLTPSPLAPAGLYVPANQIRYGFPITWVGSEGQRTVIRFSSLSSEIDPSSTSSAEATIQPMVLGSNVDAGYHVCVDIVGSPAPGLHVGLWRYVEQPSATSCGSASTATARLLGFGAERPDRIRYEFASDGHLIDLTDATGNELRLTYTNKPTAGAALGNPTSYTEVSSGRGFSFSYPSSTETDVKDPAGRTTKYVLNGSAQLTQVINPDGSSVQYQYGATCSGSNAGSLQLCSIIDPRSNATTFGYTSTFAKGGSIPGPAYIGTVTTRDKITTSYSWSPSSPTETDVTVGNELTRYSSIDPSGSVGQVDQIDTLLNYTVRTGLYWWDTTKGACRQPDPAVDHNLCRSFRESLDGTTAAEDTVFTYGPLGQLLIKSSCLNASDPTSDSAPLPTCARASEATATAGFSSAYVGASATKVYTDQVAGNGQVTSQSASGGGRWDTQTLFALVDQTQSLTPRGNDPSSTYTDFLTTMYVDNNSSGAVNAPATSNTCASTSAPATNTGLLCGSDAPKFDGVHITSRRLTYDQYGQLLTEETPKAIAETPSGQAIPKIQYTYYQNGDHDLSGTTVAGGWLKAVADPLGDTTVYAYDAAGDRVRIWDPDATHGTNLGLFPGGLDGAPGTAGGPPSCAYSETLYAVDANGPSWGPCPAAGVVAKTAFANPWRYQVAQRDALGNLTTELVDPNGNVLTRRPARGNPTSGAVNTYDISMTWTPTDKLQTSQTPVEAAAGDPPTRYGYDMFDNQSSVTDPLGNVRLYFYDAVNRHTETVWTQGPWPSDSSTVPSACRESVDDAPIADGRILCSSEEGWNGVDDKWASSDGNHQTSSFTFDGLHHQLAALVPRDSTTNLETDHAFDLDGNLTVTCPPRHFTEGGGGACAASSPTLFDTVKTYNKLDKALTTTTYENTASGTQTQVTQDGYDADGNLSSVMDANHDTTTYTFDLANRRTVMTTPRAATTTVYDPAGHVLTITTPDTSQTFTTAHTFDADGRVVDTVKGASDGINGATSSDGGQNIRTRSLYDADGHVIVTYPPNAFAPNVASSMSTRYGSTTATDNSAGWVTNAWAGSIVRAGGNSGTISGNTSNTLNLAGAWSPSQPSDGTPFTITPKADEAYKVATIYDADGRVTRIITPRAYAPFDNPHQCEDLGGTCRWDFYYSGSNPGMGQWCPWNANYPISPRAYPSLPAYYPAYPSQVELCYTDRQYDAAGRQTAFTGADGRQTTTQYTDDGLKAAMLGVSPSEDTNTGSTISFGTNTLTDTSKNWPTSSGNSGLWYKAPIVVTWHDGSNCSAVHTETAVVATNTSTSLTLTASWNTTPSNGTCFVSYRLGGQTITTMSYYYDADGKLVKTMDAMGRPTIWSYTSDELLASRTDEQNGSITHVQRWSYDGNGNMVTMQDPSQNTSSQTFYSDDRLKTTQTPGDAQGSMDVTSYVYDAAGNVTGMTSPSGNARDATNPNGLATRMTYTADNRLLTEMRPVTTDGSKWRTVTYQYNALGLKASADSQITDSSDSTVYQDAGALQYSYYDDQRLQQQTGRDGKSVEQFSYDANGHATTLVSLDGTGKEVASLSTEYYFDDLLESAASTVSGGNGAQTSYAYTGSGLTWTRQAPSSPSPILMTYNSAGALWVVQAPDPHSNPGSYQSPSLGLSSTYSWDFTYFASGELQQAKSTVTTSNSTSTSSGVLSDQSYVLNPDDTVASTTVTDGGCNTDATWTYGYDNNKRVTSWSLSGQDATQASPAQTCQAHNQVSASGTNQYFPSARLESTTATGPGTSGKQTTVTNGATWDRDGNRLSWGTNTYTYNPDGSIADGPAATSDSYNPAGDLIQDNCGTYGYNAFDQRSSASLNGSGGAGCSTAAGTANYSYDALGRMVESDFFQATSAAESKSLITYVGLGKVEDSEQNWSGSTLDDTVGYVADAGGNLRGVLGFLPSDPNYPYQVEAANDDGNGSITTMTDGYTTCDAFFDAFGASEFQGSGSGNVAPCSTGSSLNSLWYRGARLDVNAGTYQFGVRTYTPSTGTWSQPDAYGASGSDLSLTVDPTTRNPYSYANGDPVNRVDPSGHDPTIQQLQSQLAAEQAQLAALLAQDNAEQAQYQSDLAQQNRLQAEIASDQSQIASLVSGFVANEARGGWQFATMDSLVGQLGAINGQLSALQGQYDALTSQEGVLQDEMNATRGEEGTVHGQMTDTTSALAQAEWDAEWTQQLARGAAQMGVWLGQEEAQAQLRFDAEMGAWKASSGQDSRDAEVAQVERYQAMEALGDLHDLSPVEPVDNSPDSVSGSDGSQCSFFQPVCVLPSGRIGNLISPADLISGAVGCFVGAKIGFEVGAGVGAFAGPFEPVVAGAGLIGGCAGGGYTAVQGVGPQEAGG